MVYKTKVDIAYDMLMERITEGVYKPGENWLLLIFQRSLESVIFRCVRQFGDWKVKAM